MLNQYQTFLCWTPKLSMFVGFLGWYSMFVGRIPTAHFCVSLGSGLWKWVYDGSWSFGILMEWNLFQRSLSININIYIYIIYTLHVYVFLWRERCILRVGEWVVLAVWHSCNGSIIICTFFAYFSTCPAISATAEYSGIQRKSQSMSQVTHLRKRWLLLRQQVLSQFMPCRPDGHGHTHCPKLRKTWVGTNMLYLAPVAKNSLNPPWQLIRYLNKTFPSGLICHEVSLGGRTIFYAWQTCLELKQNTELKPTDHADRCSKFSQL